MKKILLCILMLLSACSNGFDKKSPSFIDVKDEDEWVSYFKISNSEKFKFSLNDYIGVWKDNHNYDCDFKLNKDLSFKMGWRQAKCKFIEQTNNTLLLDCIGHLGINDDIVQRYVKLSLYYFPNDMKFGRTKVQKNLDIFIDTDKKCVSSLISDFKKNCDRTKPADVFRNYYEIDAKDFSLCGFEEEKEEFHLIYLEKVRYDKYGNRASSTSKNIYYIGKFFISDDDFDFVMISSVPDTIRLSVNRIFDNWKTGKTFLYDKNDKKYYKFGDDKFISLVRSNLNIGTLAIIDSKVGEKYFNNNVSEDIDNELLNSIIKG